MVPDAVLSESLGELIEMLRSGAVKPLITTVLHGIENGLEAFKRALSREEMKVVLKM